jgi:hypothetical protein
MLLAVDCLFLSAVMFTGWMFCSSYYVPQGITKPSYPFASLSMPLFIVGAALFVVGVAVTVRDLWMRRKKREVKP